MSDIKRTELLHATAEIVLAYIANHRGTPYDLAGLVSDVHGALAGAVHQAPRAPVPIGDSVTPNYIVCLEDGVKRIILKRYLRTAHGLSPEEYKKKWNLPKDYPMVAPRYAKRRQKLSRDVANRDDASGDVANRDDASGDVANPDIKDP